MALCLVFCAMQSRALTITVTNNNDAGPGSLRQAIIDVNASVDAANRINFNLTGSPPVKITISSSLPTITKQVILDGTTQAGWATNAAAVALSCPSLITTGLSLSGPPSVIRGLRVQDFTNSLFDSTGIGLNTPGHTVADCQIISNYYGIAINSSSNTIGGFPASTNRNVISGNIFVGINIATSSIGHNAVSGNLIGTDPTGTSPMANGFAGVSAGIVILSSRANVIGGTKGVQTRNVISGNNGSGIFMTGEAGRLVNNVIIGNYIGLNAAGSGAISNSGSGIQINGGASNRIGGVDAGEGNVIAGNVNSGIGVFVDSLATVIQGNLIGTFADGTTAPPLLHNQLSGVNVQRSTDTLIGGSSPASRNVISGNRNYGLRIEFGANGCTARGNFIGVQSNGVAALSNGFIGVNILQSTNTTIVGNVVAGNANAGVYIIGSNVVGAVVQGNFVGVDATGDIPLPNGSVGIRIDGVDGALVGGTNSGDGNVIAFNRANAIAIQTNTAGPGHALNNALLGNLIYSNTNTPIDLNFNGATANDVAPDADTGANNFQNFPVVTNAQQGSTFIKGFLVSGLSQTYRCEFFATNVPQGMIFLGATNITTSANGTATFSVVLGGTAPTNAFVFATATDPNGNTSEFGPGVYTKPAGDSDGDGLWDAWETNNFGNTGSNGSGDNDADGFNNYFEFVSDTQPTNANSFFRLATITNGLPHFPGWISSASRWYDIEYSTNLLAPTWVTLSANIVGAGGLQTFADAADRTSRIYRVRVKVP